MEIILRLYWIMKINFVQDEATPHNNILIDAVNQEYPGILNLWYARKKSTIYSWNHDLSDEILPSHRFGDKGISLKLFKKIFSKDSLFIVGWVNPTVRLMILTMFFTRKRYSMWFDLPKEHEKRTFLKYILREFFYLLIKKSNCKVFCVGSKAVEYFKKRGFEEKKLINLPVFVIVDKNYCSHDNLEREYFKEGCGLFISAGSRLVKDKGYDLLIQALSNSKYQKDIKLVIVGKGQEKSSLNKQIEKFGLQDNVIIEDWLDIEAMRELIAYSDVFIHPARWDAFGAGTLNAMGLGTPVIASNQSGSGPDRITHGVNGWLYDAEDLQKLTTLIDFVYENKSLIKQVSKSALEKSNEWPVARGVKILMENIE